jgi:hypothetical protein
MTKRKPETAASLLGIRSQLRAAINRGSDDGYVVLTVKQARRIEAALKQFEQVKLILTETPQ